MKRKNIKGILMSPMDADNKPVIEDNSLTVMPEMRQDQPGKINNPPTGKGFMPSPSKEKMKINKAAIKKGLEMAPFDQKVPEKIKMQTPETGYSQQTEKKTRMQREPGYIVLRMRVQNGEVSVIGSRKVVGAFLDHGNLIQNGISYEAFLKERRIAIGSIPDYGEQRSFPRPNADPSHEGHHITMLPSFDFNLKIHAKMISLKDLPTLHVTLYRFKEHVPDLVLTDVPLKVRFEKEVRVVAEMNGVKVGRLRDEVQKSLKETFGK